MSKRIQKLKDRPKSLVLAGSTLGFLLLTAFVSFGLFEGFEEDVLIYIYGANESLRPFALAVTQLGSAWFLLSLIGLLFVVKWRPNAAMRLLINGAAVYAAVYLAKIIVARPRPNFILEGVLSREVFTFGFGFPSGHTAMAAAAAFALIPFMPGKTKWLAVPWILLVGWSRMYLGVHAPFDVLGGILLAAIIAFGLPLLPANRLSKYLKT